MEVSPDLVAQFMGVTNASEAIAAQLLRDSGLDLEAAIHAFFAIQDAGGLPSDAADSAAAAPAPAAPASGGEPPPPSQSPSLRAAQAAAPAAEPAVRAPLPQVVDTLLPGGAQRRSATPAAPLPPDPFAQSDGTTRGDGLAALFRRPTHLISTAPFDTAMTSGERQKRWLLVNLQSSDVFSCHIMNRDVWSYPPIEDLLQDHFIFWQRDQRSPDGSRYKQFYRFDRPPHVALIDPRSGERLRVWGGDGDPVEPRVLLRDLTEFVRTNSLDNEATIQPVGGLSSTRPTLRVPTQGREPAQMDEDAEIAAAIAASMEQPPRAVDDTGDLRMRSGTDEDEVQEVEDDVEVDVDDDKERMDGVGTMANGYGAGEVDRDTSRLLSATDPALNRSRSLRAQQDDEFEESLAMDRAKELSEKAEAQRIASMAAAEERRVRKVAEVREAKRCRVPPAPAADCTEKVTELAFRLPSGVRLQRRFLATHTIGNVYDFIESEREELAEGNFELMQAYPKKSFTDREQLLEELAPKAALVVHLKD